MLRFPNSLHSARVGGAQKTPADHLTCGCSVLATSYSRTAYRRTTIGAAAFHCRVRNGNGWGHCAIVTRGPGRTGTEPHSRFRCFAATQADADLWGPASALQFLSAVSDRGYNIFERT